MIYPSSFVIMELLLPCRFSRVTSTFLFLREFRMQPELRRRVGEVRSGLLRRESLARSGERIPDQRSANILKDAIAGED